MLKEKLITWLALVGAVVHLVIFLVYLATIWIGIDFSFWGGIIIVQFVAGLLALGTAIMSIKKHVFRYSIYSLALLAVMSPLNTLGAAVGNVMRSGFSIFTTAVFFASLLSCLFIAIPLVLLALRDKSLTNK